MSLLNFNLKDNRKITFGDNKEIELTHVPNTGLMLTNEVDGSYPPNYDYTANPNATNGYYILDIFDGFTYTSSTDDFTDINMNGTSTDNDDVKYLFKFDNITDIYEIKLKNVLGDGLITTPNVKISLSTYDGNSIFSDADTDPEGFRYSPSTGFYEILSGNTVSSSGTTTATNSNIKGYYILTVHPYDNTSSDSGSYEIHANTIIYPPNYDSTANPNETNGYKILNNTSGGFTYTSSDSNNDNTDMDGTNNVKYLFKFDNITDIFEIKLKSVYGDGDGDGTPDVKISLSTFDGNSIFSDADTDPEGFRYSPSTGFYEILDGNTVNSSGTTTATNSNIKGYYILTVHPYDIDAVYTGRYEIYANVNPIIYPSNYDSTANPNATNGYYILENTIDEFTYTSSAAENTNMDGTNDVKYLFKFDNITDIYEIKLKNVNGDGAINIPNVKISLSTYDGNSIFSDADTDPEGFRYSPSTGFYEILSGNTVSSSGTTTTINSNIKGYYILTVHPKDNTASGSYEIHTTYYNKAMLSLNNSRGNTTCITLKNSYTNNSFILGIHDSDKFSLSSGEILSSADNIVTITNNNNVGINNVIPSVELDVVGDIKYTGTITDVSDDRLKENEVLITDAVTTIQKLRPQIYDKKPSFTNTNTTNWTQESGLIAQEVYYDATELRHLVKIPDGVTPDETITTSTDPSVDPDYSSWGDKAAALNYIGIIPYLVKSIQELKTIIDTQDDTITNLTTRITALENP